MVTGDTIPQGENAIVICNHQDMADITGKLRQLIRRSGISDGHLSATVVGSTGSVYGGARALRYMTRKLPRLWWAAPVLAGENGFDLREACIAALVEPLSDDPETIDALREVIDASLG